MTELPQRVKCLIAAEAVAINTLGRYVPGYGTRVRRFIIMASLWERLTFEERQAVYRRSSFLLRVDGPAHLKAFLGEDSEGPVGSLSYCASPV